MAEPKPFASLSSNLLARKGAARPAMRPQGFGQLGNGLEDLGWDDMGVDPPASGPRDATPEDIDGEARIHHPTGLTPVQSPVHGQQAELADRLGIDEEDEDFDETAELYDPDAVDADAEDEETEGDDIYEASSFEAEPVAVPEKPKKQPLQLSGGFDETPQEAPVEEAFQPTDSFDQAPAAAASDDPLELTERLDDFDPFQETDEVEAAVPPPPPAPVYESGYAYQPAPVRAQTVRAAPGSKAKAAFTLRLDPERHLKLRLACAVNGRSAQQIVTDAVDQLLREMPELEALAEKAKRKG